MKRIAAAVLVVLIAGFAFLIVVRGQFSTHLKESYPEKTFSVGFAKVDPIYGKFYARGTCLDDYTIFGVRKSWKTKRISDDYPDSKSQNEYNTMIKGLFLWKPVQKEIRSVTGGGKRPFDGSGYYEQVHFHLVDEKEHVSDIKDIIEILEENGIFAERISFIYEKDGHVYRLTLSTEDYKLNEEGIKNRIEMIK
jgi:hypothetical protein